MSEESTENPPLRNPRHRAVIYLLCVLALGLIPLISLMWLRNSPNSGDNRAYEPAEITSAQPKLPTSQFIITRADGKRLPFQLELATTVEQQEKGLMFRQEMQANEGMIFVYQTDEVRAMWMRNTPMPLDILFVNAEGMIVEILSNTVPFSEMVLRSEFPSRYVIELRGGVANAYGIQLDDRISGNFTPSNANASGEVR